MMRIHDIKGQKFGRLLVLSRAESPDEYARWLCQCDCGNQCIARGHTLRDGRTKSCGCFSRETVAARQTTHGGTVGGKVSPEYTSYRKMRERCLSPQHRHYANYGGRGVAICDRWLAGFGHFLSDMGKRPTPAHTLDRIDSNGNYEPSNCRWATRKEQNRSTRFTKPIRRSDGETYKTAGEAAELTGWGESAIRYAAVARRKYQGFGWEFLP